MYVQSTFKNTYVLKNTYIGRSWTKWTKFDDMTNDKQPKITVISLEEKYLV